MSEPHVRIVQEQDWAGLYIEGNLVYEDHQVENDVLINAMKRAHLLNGIDIAVEWGADLPRGGRFPARYADVVRK